MQEMAKKRQCIHYSRRARMPVCIWWSYQLSKIHSKRLINFQVHSFSSHSHTNTHSSAHSVFLVFASCSVFVLVSLFFSCVFFSCVCVCGYRYFSTIFPSWKSPHAKPICTEIICNNHITWVSLWWMWVHWHVERSILITAIFRSTASKNAI